MGNGVSEIVAPKRSAWEELAWKFWDAVDRRVRWLVGF